MSNYIYEIIDFIRTSKIIITNSYHGIYWATLMKRKVIATKLFSNRFNYFKYPPQKYSGDIINNINKSKIHEHILDESIDLTINYFNEIKNYLKETQSKLFNINYDWIEKYYNDFQVYESFNNYIEDKNNKLENMYKELNDKCNNLASVFNEVIDKIAWWIPIRKWRDSFKNKFRIII